MEKQEDNPLRKLFSQGRQETYDKGEVILMPGKYPRGVYMVKSGYIKSYTIDNEGRYHILSVQAPSDLFPLHLVFDNYEKDIFYQAITPVTLLRISKHKFKTALRQDQPLLFAMLEVSLNALRNYSQRLRNLELSEAADKVIYRLIYLGNLFGLPGKDNQIVVSLPLNYQDLADSLNITRETANREVRKLVKRGWIKKSRNYLVILNKNALISALNS